MLNGSAKHLLMPEADTCVVAPADVSKVVHEGFEQRVILVIDVERLPKAEGALL